MSIERAPSTVSLVLAQVQRVEPKPPIFLLSRFTEIFWQVRHCRNRIHRSKALCRPGWSYFGLIAGLPPGVPGGGMTGIVAPEGGGICLIPGSTSAGGITTPPERLRSELVVPLAGGTAGVVG